MSTNPITEDGVARLLAFLKLTEQIEKLSNVALAEAVMNKVWGQLPMGSERDALLNEMISRFERLSGIQRNEVGEIVEPQQKPYWVIRFEDGAFNMGLGHTVCLPEATRYPTSEAAHEVADTLVMANVIKIDTIHNAIPLSDPRTDGGDVDRMMMDAMVEEEISKQSNP